jgi:hypothetical protein
MEPDEFDKAAELAVHLETRQASILRRKIVDTERRWVVRAGFRFHYHNNGPLTRDEANKLADDILAIIDETRQQQRERQP